MWSEWVKKSFYPAHPRSSSASRLLEPSITWQIVAFRPAALAASRNDVPPRAWPSAVRVRISVRGPSVSQVENGVLLLARARSSAPSVLSLKLGSSVTLGGSWLARLHLAARGQNDVPSRAWPSAGGVRVRLVETLRHGPARRPAGSAPRPCSFAPRRCCRCRWRWWGRPSRSAARVRPGCACSSRSRRRRRARGRRRCACAARPCPSAKWRCSPRPSARSWLRSVVGFPGSACSA